MDRTLAELLADDLSAPGNRKPHNLSPNPTTTVIVLDCPPSSNRPPQRALSSSIAALHLNHALPRSLEHLPPAPPALSRPIDARNGTRAGVRKSQEPGKRWNGKDLDSGKRWDNRAREGWQKVGSESGVACGGQEPARSGSR